MHIHTAILIFSICFVVVARSKDLPSYFPKCNIDDPKLNDCLLKATETCRPYVIKGVPELNIPSIDPLFIPEIALQQGTNAVNYKLKLVNATIKGMGDYLFKDMSFDPKTISMKGTAFFKSQSLIGQYDVKGKILLAPVYGKGTVKVELGPSTGSLESVGRLVNRKGEEYIEVVDVKAKIGVSNHTAEFDGLFDGNEELAQAIRQILKEHGNEILKEMLPALEEVAGQIFLRLLSGVSKEVPYRKLFPPSE